MHKSHRLYHTHKAIDWISFGSNFCCHLDVKIEGNLSIIEWRNESLTKPKSHMQFEWMWQKRNNSIRFRGFDFTFFFLFPMFVLALSRFTVSFKPSANIDFHLKIVSSTVHRSFIRFQTWKKTHTIDLLWYWTNLNHTSLKQKSMQFSFWLTVLLSDFSIQRVMRFVLKYSRFKLAKTVRSWKLKIENFFFSSKR